MFTLRTPRCSSMLLALLILGLLALPLPSWAQNTPVVSGLASPTTRTVPDTSTIHLTVLVTPKSGVAFAGLQQSGFTVLDNKVPQPLTSFHAVSAAQQPIPMVLVLDSVNQRYTTTAYARTEIIKFLRQNEGQLTQPTTFALITDTGTTVLTGFTRDGNALAVAVEKAKVPLREFASRSGIYGAEERTDISLKALRELSQHFASLPGPKQVLWVSPGWPLLSGPRIELSTRQEDNIFRSIVEFSTELRQSGIILSNINPVGPTEDLLRADYYETYLKGVAQPRDAELADLSLQVLAVQTGGQVFVSNSDVAGALARSAASAMTWYELAFRPSATGEPNQYHAVQVLTGNPALTVRTSTGYYANPAPLQDR